MTLKYIRNGYRTYLEKRTNGEPQHPWDIKFYDSLARPARKNIKNTWPFHKFIVDGEIDGLKIDKDVRDFNDVSAIMASIAGGTSYAFFRDLQAYLYNAAIHFDPAEGFEAKKS